MRNDRKILLRIALLVYFISLSLYFLFMGYKSIKVYFGVPNIYTHIENENSDLLNFLLQKDNFHSDWMLSSIMINQSDNSSEDIFLSSAYIAIDGKYKGNKFELIQTIKDFSKNFDIFTYVDKKTDTILQSNDQIIQAIIKYDNEGMEKSYIYCYNKFVIKNNSEKTVCKFYQIEGNIFEEIVIEFEDKISNEDIGDIINLLNTTHTIY